ncbi:MAG TPA: hypothetical protein DCQ50_05230 [Chryseobacterium sp.]|nr:hypothetical protein [Chryseobacterium sp.]
MNREQLRLENEISIKDFVEKIFKIWHYLLKKWVIILLAGFLGLLLGCLTAWLLPVKYQSRITFIVEENKTSLGGLAAIAGQFGFDIGGASNAGVFSGKNVLLFLTSENLCRETLLTNYDSSGKVLLADKYAEVNLLKRKWQDSKKIKREINFSKYKNENMPRLEDSLLQLIIRQIIKKDLLVEKPDNDASFIEVTISTRDELLSKYFSERLVKIATDRYVESKTRVKTLNVAKLQRRADSLGALLNNKTYSAASTQQMLVDLNPALRTAPVAAEITTRDKTMIATIFAEVVKNLEIAKVALSQETPVVQIIDQSYLPLKKEKYSFLICGLSGALIGAVIISLILLTRHWWKNNMNF